MQHDDEEGELAGLLGRLHFALTEPVDFSHDDPALDTVTYAETPSPLAGYKGPDFQTISVKALWVAMQAYLREFPADPMNVIS